MTAYVHPAKQLQELEARILALKKRLEEDPLSLEEKKEISGVIVEKCRRLALLCYQIQGIEPPPELLGKSE